MGGPLRQRAAGGTLSWGEEGVIRPNPTWSSLRPGAVFWTRPLQRPQYWSSRHKDHVLPQVRELIDKVRAVFVETLDELSWMDSASKKKAQEKVGGPWSAEVRASHQQTAAPG